MKTVHGVDVGEDGMEDEENAEDVVSTIGKRMPKYYPGADNYKYIAKARAAGAGLGTQNDYILGDAGEVHYADFAGTTAFDHGYSHGPHADKL